MKPVEAKEFINFRSACTYIDEKTDEGFQATVLKYMGAVTVTIWPVNGGGAVRAEEPRLGKHVWNIINKNRKGGLRPLGQLS